MGILAGILRVLLWDPQNKGSQFLISGKFRSIFREKLRSSIKIFRAHFVLQTCHPNDQCL